MESIKRYIKIFFTEHGDPIKFYAILIVLIIVIVQSLNAIVKNKNNRDNKIVFNTTKVESIDDKEIIKEQKKIIKEFIKNCQDNKIDEAYEMLSAECVKEHYQTKEKFYEEYYKKMFSINKDIDIEYISEDTYEIKFYESILESGRIEDRKYISNTYKIVKDEENEKIYINFIKEISEE